MSQDVYFGDSVARSLRHFWFPVARVQDLDSPRSAILLGERLVVFRGAEGSTHVTASRCIHRGGDLSAGTVVGEAIQCPYHGWQFDGVTGACTRIPSQTDQSKIPANATIRTYPAVERFGHVWTCLEEPVFDLPNPEELEGLDLEWRVGEPIPVGCGFMAATENFRDVAHFPFVHRASMGEVDEVVPPIRVTRDGREVRASFRYEKVNGGEYSSAGSAWMHYHSYAPGIAAIYYEYDDGGKRYLINFPSPIGSEQSIIYWALATDRSFKYWALATDRSFKSATIDDLYALETRVFNEDTPVLEGLRPREISLGKGDLLEVSCTADLYTLNYRRAAKYALEAAAAVADQPIDIGSKPAARNSNG